MQNVHIKKVKARELADKLDQDKEAILSLLKMIRVFDDYPKAQLIAAIEKPERSGDEEITLPLSLNPTPDAVERTEEQLIAIAYSINIRMNLNKPFAEIRTINDKQLERLADLLAMEKEAVIKLYEPGLSVEATPYVAGKALSPFVLGSVSIREHTPDKSCPRCNKPEAMVKFLPGAITGTCSVCHRLFKLNDAGGLNPIT